MTTSIFLVRHGLRYHTKGDPGLTEEGVEQAKMVGKYLQQYPIAQVCTSPLLRAKETAYYINTSLHLEITIDERLRERVNWGDNPTHTFADFLAIWKKTKADRHWVPPVGASSEATGNRILELLAELPDDLPGIVLVSHGGTISDTLRSEFSAEELDAHVPHFHLGWDENLPECSITELRKHESGLDIVSIGKVL